MATVRIETSLWDETKVYSPYDPDRVSIIKSIPGKRWNREGKYWTIPHAHTDYLAQLLRDHGDDVTIIRAGARPAADSEELRHLRAEVVRLTRDNTRLRREAEARSGNWADDLLKRCPPELADKVFRALTTKLHPDVGGDSDLMRDLNVARDRIGVRR